MCGICGKIDYRTKRPVPKEVLKAMADSIAHRGPDDEGYYCSDYGYGAGFRRLSIIDLGGGHQPMSDETGKIWIVFNGEIFNYPELRSELEARGYRFRTKADTEVIIHGYREWGDEVLDRLNGMFGFAIWDDVAQRLLIARDRMGIKLIYYRDEGGVLTFGSEARAVLAGDPSRPVLSPLAVSLFLRYRYTPSPLTVYEGIKKLAPGCCLVVENGSVEERRWWNYAPYVDRSIKESDAVDALEELYEQAVARHLLSDVPVGLLLSGGVDSALLLALMNRKGDGWRSFSVGFGDSYLDDELADARRSAELLGARHEEVRIDRLQFENTLSAVISCLEEPIATASIVPMYHVCECAARTVKVALIGQGPDELFGGYTRHLGLRYGKYWRGLPAAARSFAKARLGGLRRNETVKRALYSLDVADRIARYQNVFSLAPADSIESLFLDGLLAPGSGDRILDCWRDLMPLMSHTEELGGFQFLELRSSLPDELLMYADKLSMAHGLELRVPYLDREIVEYVETIPDEIKMSWMSRKRLHKRVAESFLPREIVMRKKRAFSQNIVDGWFSSSMNGKFGSYIEDASSHMYGWLKYDAVNRLLREHRLGQQDNYKLLFSLVVFEEWLRQSPSMAGA